MYPNGSCNFNPTVRAREQIAEREANYAADRAAYREMALNEGLKIGFGVYSVKNYQELVDAQKDMVKMRKEFDQPRVQKLYVSCENKRISEELINKAFHMGKRFGYYVLVLDREPL